MRQTWSFTCYRASTGFHRRRVGLSGSLRRRSELLDAEVAESPSRVVGEESDVAGGAAQAGVLLEVFGIGHGRQVGFDDDSAVEGHDDVRALGGDLFAVPFTNRL